MSIQYQKEIFSDGRKKLYINFAGISPENTTNKDNLLLNIYAFDISDYKQIFKASLSYSQILDLFNHLNSVSIIRENSKSHTERFVGLSNEVKEIVAIVEHVDTQLIKSILDKAGEDEKLKLIVEALTESEINNLEASIKQSQHQKALAHLE